jgi:hypothetical protein
MLLTPKRKENLIDAMEIAIASYHHKIKIAKDCSRLGSVDFRKCCKNKIENYYDMIKILKKNG